jgi:hypothetical protein
MSDNGVIAGRGAALLDDYTLNCQSMVVSPAKETASKIVGMGGVAGTKVEPRAPTAKLKIIVTEDVSLAELAALRNVSGTFEFANGTTYTGIGCDVTNAPEHSNDDGTADIEIEMVDCIPA